MQNLSAEVQKTEGLDKLLTGKMPDVKKALGEVKFSSALAACIGLKTAIDNLSREDRILNSEVQARENSD